MIPRYAANRYLLSIVVFAATSPAHAGLLASFTGSMGAIAPAPQMAPVSIRMSIGASASNCFNISSSCAILFELYNFDTSIVGSTFTLSAADPGFAAAVSMLTNGADDDINLPGAFGSTVPDFPGGATGFSEHAFGTVPGPDFLGHSIGSISLLINSFTFSNITLPAPVGQGSGFITYTQAHVGFTLSVSDTATPEPAAWQLCFGGMMLLGMALPFARLLRN